MKFNHQQMRDIASRFLDDPDPYDLNDPVYETDMEDYDEQEETGCKTQA